jgi:UDP-N-acetylmuramyl tripeptide synthase
VLENLNEINAKITETEKEQALADEIQAAIINSQESLMVVLRGKGLISEEEYRRVNRPYEKLNEKLEEGEEDGED